MAPEILRERAHSGGSGSRRLLHRQPQPREIQLAMLAVAKGERIIHHHLGRDCAQARDCRVRLIEQPLMGVAGSEKSIRGREKRRVLDSNPQPRDGLFETPAKNSA